LLSPPAPEYQDWLLDQCAPLGNITAARVNLAEIRNLYESSSVNSAQRDSRRRQRCSATVTSRALRQRRGCCAAISASRYVRAAG
jgi:hypothetical protein